ncbi:unnamed protein product [Staurois parvus]|uniref:Uncharacterized protein n=1 Tax=Staurois parvus TaxID=386267 RepID=A0ABN9BVP8_9NEOB|nr:unnamed protein product [Staurois parvus]
MTGLALLIDTPICDL